MGKQNARQMVKVGLSFATLTVANGITLTPMKIHWLYLGAAVGGLTLFALALPPRTSGQSLSPAVEASAEPTEVSPQLAALINDVSAQSKQMAANQAQIDEKLDQLTETIRQARIFAARGGK
jgi:hypothetical protein